MARMVSGSSCTAPAAAADDKVLEDDEEDDSEDATLALGENIVSRTPSAAAGGAISP